MHIKRRRAQDQAPRGGAIVLGFACLEDGVRLDFGCAGGDSGMCGAFGSDDDDLPPPPKRPVAYTTYRNGSPYDIH